MIAPPGDSTAIAIALAFVIAFLTGAVGYILARIVTMRKRYPRKTLRYEAGNPPAGRARGLFMMQYYAYLVVYLTVEPIIILLFVILTVPRVLLTSAALLFLIILSVLIPPLMFGLDSARRLELWSVKEEEY